MQTDRHKHRLGTAIHLVCHKCVHVFTPTKTHSLFWRNQTRFMFLSSLNMRLFADSIHLHCGLYKQLPVPQAAFPNPESHKASTGQLVSWIRSAENRSQRLPAGALPLCTLVEPCEVIWPFSSTVCSICCDPVIPKLVTLLRAISP